MKNKGYSKLVAILALILVTTTSLWFVLPATPCYAQGGYEEPPSGGGVGAGPPSSYTYVGGKVDNSGIFTTDVTTETSDGLCQLTIETGTKALDRVGNPLVSILIMQDRYPPSSPPAGNIIGLVYDYLPYGATFDPPINMTFTYNPNTLPAGVSEESLVIAYWKSGNWVNLEGPFTIDVENNTISTPVSHFADFTIIAYTNPAAFTTSSLTISPTVINPGQDIAIGVTVTNTGDLAGSHEITLMIDDKAIDTKEVTLAGHASEKATFSTIADYAVGEYAINVNGLSGTLTIQEPITPAPAPAPAPPAPPVTPPAPPPAPPAPPVTPPVTPPAPPPAPPVAPPAPPPALPVTPINWWLIGGIIAAVIIIAVVVWLLVTRRRV